MIRKEIIAYCMVSLLIGSVPHVDARGYTRNEVAAWSIGAGVVVGGGLFLMHRFGYLDGIKAFLAEKYPDNKPLQNRILYGGMAGSSAIAMALAGYGAYRNTPGYIKGSASAYYNKCKKNYDEALNGNGDLKNLVVSGEEGRINILLERPEQLESFTKKLKIYRVKKLKEDAVKFRECSTGMDEPVDETFITELYELASKIGDTKRVVKKLIALKKVKEDLKKLDGYPYSNVFKLKREGVVHAGEGDIRAAAGVLAAPYTAIDELLKKISSIIAEIEKNIEYVEKTKNNNLDSIQQTLNTQITTDKAKFDLKRNAFVEIHDALDQHLARKVNEERELKRQKDRDDLAKLDAEANRNFKDKTSEAALRHGKGRENQGRADLINAVAGAAETGINLLQGQPVDTDQNNKSKRKKKRSF